MLLAAFSQLRPISWAMLLEGHSRGTTMVSKLAGIVDVCSARGVYGR
jgi:hypothetical protein